MAERQISLFCGCGSADLWLKGRCRRCYRRERLSLARFDGLRESVLRRDGDLCQVCGSGKRIVVHHRRAGASSERGLVTLCRACHVRVHHTNRPSASVSGLLRILWREANVGIPEQRRLWRASDDPEGEAEAAEQPDLFGGV